MTYKNGFAVGAVLGLVSWFYFHGFIPFVPVLFFFKFLIFVVGATFFVLSVVLAFVTAFRRKAVFGTSVDGFVYGFTAIFDLLYISYQFYLGNFPFSMYTIIL
jgi:hypothetical protein